ncbi:hypothetical protein ACPV3S_12915 [Photobacterium damselae]|uniref:hypothetical protein n=1 Tax=Photobacterium damselae TaxID=38293 RepID=UPI004067E0E7
MNNLKTQLQNIFNLQSLTEIYHHFSTIWSAAFKIVATFLVTYAATFVFAFVAMINNSKPATFPEFYSNLLATADISADVTQSVLSLMVIFLILKFGFYLLIRRNQGQGSVESPAK